LLHQRFFPLVLLAALIAIVYWIAFLPPSATQSPSLNESRIVPELMLDASYLSQLKVQQPQRESYGVPTQVFSDLPPLPSDFGLLLQLLQENRLRFDQVPERYWKQPEFLPKFEERALSFWKKPDATRWFVQGYGFYPAGESISLKRGEQKTVVAFVHTAFGVRTFQGMRLNPVMESNRSGFLSVQVQNPIILLEPAYPKFYANWIQRVSLVVSVRENAPIGEYRVSLQPAQPPTEYGNRWRDDYGSYYVGSGGSPLGRPQFQLKVAVVE